MKISKLYRNQIGFRIESLIEYNSFVEANIENELSGIQTKFEYAQKEYEEYKKKNPEKIDDDEYMMDYFDDLSYNHSKIQDNIILKHRNSLIFLINSLIESELYSFAKNNSLSVNVFSIDDLQGNSIFEKFKKYISKTNPKLYDSIKEELLFFDRIRLLRNFITHHNNIIRSNNTHFSKIKEFSRDNFELEKLGMTYNTDIEVYIIKLNNKKIINTIFEKLNIVFDKMYLEN
ncbi:hypothetical protein OX284_005865 [Flavobacterium sp. SUN046]|uniref:hypothetical protein n=1 Tax=Flavobacterium sp. SUN046 TaxID=3002440 RepID=UPI002DBEC8F4|nr:hypothetical protein [Flavobacterium sp. SUN046]MEC4048945.1 hypothetical protein [Flavobacterium sp. SUN046]